MATILSLAKDRAKRAYAPAGRTTELVTVRPDGVRVFAPIDRERLQWFRSEPGHFLRLGDDIRIHCHGDVDQETVSRIHQFISWALDAHFGTRVDYRFFRARTHKLSRLYPNVKWFEIAKTAVRAL